MKEFVHLYLNTHQDIIQNCLFLMGLSQERSSLFTVQASYGISYQLWAIYLLLMLFIDAFFLKFSCQLVIELIHMTNRKIVRKKLTKVTSGELLLNPKEILNLSTKQKNDTWNRLNQPGVYLLFNTQNKTYYIGQATRMLDRVCQHFLGKGNQDVYADYRYGKPFDIQFISLLNSGYLTLNELEREAIKAYQGYSRGYNRNRGMKG